MLLRALPADGLVGGSGDRGGRVAAAESPEIKQGNLVSGNRVAVTRRHARSFYNRRTPPFGARCEWGTRSPCRIAEYDTGLHNLARR